MIKKPPRTYDNLLMLFNMTGMPLEEAATLARRFADNPELIAPERKQHAEAAE